MKKLTFEIDYSYCPKGHSWLFIPTSTLFADLFWCRECDCFYEPSVRVVKYGVINKNFNSDREKDLIKRAKFLEWKKTLNYKDMPIN